MDVVHVDVTCVRFEGCIDVLMDELQEIRLLHGYDVVGIEHIAWVRLPQLFVQRE